MDMTAFSSASVATIYDPFFYLLPVAVFVAVGLIAMVRLAWLKARQR